MRDRTDALGADLDAETPAGTDAGKESADTVIAVRGEELPVSVTLWHRADHESMELSGAIDTGSVDRCYCRREYRSGKTQCLCSGDGSSVKNDFSGEVSGTQAAEGDFVDWAIRCVEEHPHPLALYFFSEDKKAQRRILDHCHFGGGCINDTIIHLATSAMPFGGVGESGMGGYHGRTGFETFSHYRSIVDKKTWMDLPIRYQRYDEKKEKLLRRFLK